MAQVSTVSRVSNASGVTSAQSTRGAQAADAGTADADATSVPSAAALAANSNAQASEKVLPLPGWLTKVYFIFPVVLYIPDALFNYYVYSDGISTKSTNPVLQVGFIILWSFLSVGVVGMAYLLSVLAPWHWGQGHRIQAIFCGFGVVVATGITTWNSLAYRSQNFVQFQTDQWAYALWPQLKANHISVTMILVSIAPPFWGLFWAIVQPTQTGRSLRQLQESHEERLMRLQQEAELKRLRAQTNATIREAQVRGMAQTATALREQASGVLAQRRNKGAESAEQSAAPAAKADADTTAETTTDATAENAATAATADATSYDGGATLGGPNDSAPSNIFQYPTFNPNQGRESNHSNSMLNRAGAAAAMAYAEPVGASQSMLGQPALLGDADALGTPMGDTQTSQGWMRRPPLGQGVNGVFFSGDNDEPDGMTGTTGPRAAIRRAAEPGALLRAMNEPSRAYVQAVQESMRELNPSGARKTIPARELATRVAEKLNVDETAARQIITRVREAQKTARS
ncbi:MAG TPA: hypothetical protein VMV29_22145 [Ktedonobacterales bacterium]|nr:hypothetical protein [Ktedonobacterales bacterium]